MVRLGRLGGCQVKAGKRDGEQGEDEEERFGEAYLARFTGPKEKELYAISAAKRKIEKTKRS